MSADLPRRRRRVDVDASLVGWMTLVLVVVLVAGGSWLLGLWR